MAEEVELKLAVQPAHMAKLRRVALLRSVARSRARTAHLKSTYYDTPALNLKDAGMSLRVRKTGHERVQTFKAPTGTKKGYHHRQEIETPLDGETPDIGRFGDTGLERLLTRNGQSGRLLPVFTTEFERQRIPVRIADSEIELVLDQGVVTSKGRSEPICEAELELKSGSPARLYELALDLNEKIPFRVEARTKAVRGYDLFAGKSAAPVGTSHVDLTPGLPSADAMRALARSCLDQLRGNEAAVFAGADPEGIHQMRIAVRRLRALLKVFSSLVQENIEAYLTPELEWLQQTLGAARDADVFVLETLVPLQKQFGNDKSLRVLREVADAARENAYARAQRALSQRRYTSLLLRLDLWLDRDGLAPTRKYPRGKSLKLPVGKFAKKVLDRRRRKLRRLGDVHRELSLDELHAVRIEAKKLRYTTEFMASLYRKKPTKSFRNRLKSIQDTLGSLNDSVVGKRLVAELIKRGHKAGKDREALAKAEGMIAGWRAARLEADLARFGDVWAEFTAAKPFWRG